MIDTPLLQTERFDLWQPRGPQDLAALCNLISDEETRRFLGHARAELPAQWERFMRNAGSWAIYRYGVFQVRPRGDEDLIASIGVFHSWRGFDPSMDDQPEAGWIVRRDWWGRGVAVEVMRAVLAWFDATHAAPRIVAMIDQGNTASVKVAGKLGFARYGGFTDPDGTTLDMFERVR